MEKGLKLLNLICMMENKLERNQVKNIDSPKAFIDMAETVCKVVTQATLLPKKIAAYHLFQGIRAMELIRLKFGEKKYPAAMAVLNNLHQLVDDIFMQVENKSSTKKPHQFYPTKQAIHACEIQVEVAGNMLKEMKESAYPENQEACESENETTA